MLLKFTTTDMLNSTLIDVSTGDRAYDITTVLLPSDSESEAGSSTQASFSDEPSSTSLERRQTHITDASGSILVSISWKGRQPSITLLNEKVGGLTDLFGSSTVRFMPKILVIPTRFDTEYIWTATPDSLTLFDYDSELTKGTFHQNVIRLPGSFKSKTKSLASTPSPSVPSSSSSSSSLTPPSPLSISPPSILSSSSSLSLAPSSHPLPATPHTTTPKCAFIPTHLPGLGNNYLEFCQHPLAHDVEIIVSFLMMEILRRGRFSLTPYTFEKPKMWQLKEARDLVLRRLRRNTV